MQFGSDSADVPTVGSSTSKAAALIVGGGSWPGLLSVVRAMRLQVVNVGALCNSAADLLLWPKSYESRLVFACDKRVLVTKWACGSHVPGGPWLHDDISTLADRRHVWQHLSWNVAHVSKHAIYGVTLSVICMLSCISAPSMLRYTGMPVCRGCDCAGVMCSSGQPHNATKRPLLCLA